ncbi:MAG TPA: lysophospholipid acyltransferase family protein [Tepidisphaeraceae bacterium]|nr:lysophospholipid acyltransferase family protein [Tepidisphaeraceae bacterium]
MPHTAAPSSSVQASLATTLVRHIARLYLALFKRFTLGNAPCIPPAGPVIFVANHTTGYDPVCLQVASRSRFIQFMMAKEYYLQKPLYWFYKSIKVIPVNRTGNDTASIRTALRALAGGACIGMFPEGGISDDGRLREGRQGVALLALMSAATVVPAYIKGTRPHAGMVTDFLRFDKITFYFGRPLRFDDLQGRHDDSARQIATQRIMAEITRLRDEHDPAKRPAPPS